MNKTIGVACDHAGYQAKELVVGYLSAKGFEVVDYGCMSEESVDYADHGHALANGIESGEVKRGVGFCGSGEGMAITLNKHQGVRAGLVWCDEIASLIRQHNNTNAIVFPARFLTNDEIISALEIWLTTPFEGGRHEPRVAKIAIPTKK